jgi:hypothetical protein
MEGLAGGLRAGAEVPRRLNHVIDRNEVHRSIAARGEKHREVLRSREEEEDEEVWPVESIDLAGA